MACQPKGNPGKASAKKTAKTKSMSKKTKK